MIGKVFGAICILSFFSGIILGNGASLGDAVLDGAADAVKLTISLCGIMSLWCGIMRVLERAGIIERISKLLSPVIKIFFPDAYKSGEGVGEISANISANLLGIGNAATPFALKAMEKLQSINEDPSSASDDMITLAVLNTASLNLIPTTLIALRRAEGAEDPYSIVIPVLIVSFTVSTLALVLCRLLRLKRKRSGGPNG